MQMNTMKDALMLKNQQPYMTYETQKEGSDTKSDVGGWYAMITNIFMIDQSCQIAQNIKLQQAYFLISVV